MRESFCFFLAMILLQYSVTETEAAMVRWSGKDFEKIPGYLDGFVDGSRLRSVPLILNATDDVEILCRSSKRDTEHFGMFYWAKDAIPISWMNNFAPNTVGKGLLAITAEGNLRIYSVDRKDAGVYSCILEGHVPECVEYPIVIQVPLAVSLDAPGEKVTEGMAITLNCHVTSIPAAHVWWSRTQFGPPLTEESQVNNKSLSWTITNVTSDVTGSYYCNADNGVGGTVTKFVDVIVDQTQAIKKLHEVPIQFWILFVLFIMIIFVVATLAFLKYYQGKDVCCSEEVQD